MAVVSMTQQQRDSFLKEISRNAANLIRVLDVVSPYEEVITAMNAVGWRREDSQRLRTELDRLAAAAKKAQAEGGTFSV